MFTDTHCHLYKEYYEDMDEIIRNAKSNGIGRFFVSGVDTKSNQEVLNLTKKYNSVFATLGIHPEYASEYTKEDLVQLEHDIQDSKVIAVGEIGLDYHYTKDNKFKQKQLFIIQLELAKKYNMPVVIHSRDATQDTIDILKEYKLQTLIHAFSGSLEVAKEYVKLGYCLGIGGVVTFKNAHLKEYLKSIPMENIVLETDSPYLTPHPYRGKRNEPKYIDTIAQNIAEIYDVPKSQVLKFTNDNIARIFDI